MKTVSKQGLSKQSKYLRNYLKMKFKAQGLNYKKIAKPLGVSETTIKRWMTSQDFGVETLFAISKLLSLDSLNLIDQGLKKDGLGHIYTLEQDRFLALHRFEHLVFIKLVMGCPFANLVEEMGVAPSRIIAALVKLEKVKILKLMPNNKILFLIKGPFRWRPDGLMQKTFFSAMREEIFAHFKSSKAVVDVPQDSCALFRPFELYLDKATAKNMSEELANVLLKYRSISHTSNREWPNAVPVAGVIAVDQWDLWKSILLA